MAWYLHVLGLQVTEQHPTPAAVLPPDQLAAATAAGAGLPSRTPPVVLCYHDVRPIGPTEKYPDPRTNPGYQFVVTPEAFEAQLSALQAAGYTSITSDQYLDYLGGGAVPERSVIITFDDGTHGLWTYADKILERHGMHGVAFLITGNVGTKRPYYLSWQEIDRMAASGRWDFQSHTRKMHARLPVDAGGAVASEIVHRRWLFETNRAETLGEFELKIRADLRGSVQDIVNHRLPRPKLFAFPFSEGYRDLQSGNMDPQAAAIAVAVVREMFAAFVYQRAATATALRCPRGCGRHGRPGRAETRVHAGRVLNKCGRTRQSPRRRRHRRNIPTCGRRYTTTRRALVRAAVTRLRLLGSGRWQGIAYGQHATADWASYRGSVTMSGLTETG